MLVLNMLKQSGAWLKSEMSNDFFVFEILDLQLLGWFPLMCDHCSGRLSGGSHRSVGEAEKRVQKPGLPRQLVWTVCARERREPSIGSVRRNADPDCARDVDAVLTHEREDEEERKREEREREREREGGGGDQTNHQHKNTTKILISNDDQNSSSPKWIYIFHLEKKTFFARDNGKKKSSGNAQAHLPDSGSISWNINQILNWNDGLNFWKVLVTSVVFYNITVCYEWIITVGFPHSQRPSCIIEDSTYSPIHLFLYALCQYWVLFIRVILVKPSVRRFRGLLTHPEYYKKVSNNNDANNNHYDNNNYNKYTSGMIKGIYLVAYKRAEKLYIYTYKYFIKEQRSVKCSHEELR